MEIISSHILLSISIVLFQPQPTKQGKMQIASTLFRVPIGGNSDDGRQSTTF